MVRTEYLDDPAAPAAGGLLPAAYALVRNSVGQVLLVRRADDGNWELPGGRIDVGESACDAVVREVAEEADVDIKVTAVSGIYSHPGHVLDYPGERTYQQLAICFHARAFDDIHARPDGTETTAAGWFDSEQLDDVVMHPAVRRRVTEAVTQPEVTHFD